MSENKPMQGKVVVITGATSGLGEAAAIEMARQGATIICIARDQGRLDVSMPKIRAAGPAAAHKSYLADFSSIADMKRVGALIAAETPKIDVLANNAGAMLSKRVTTVDGLELTFAVNHMAPFVLTNALMESLKRATNARIINTSSSAHSFIKAIDFDDLDSKSEGILTAYALSKLCNILHANELAKRLAGSNIVANSFHPGMVRTRFGTGNGWISVLINGWHTMTGVTAEQGGDTLVWLASSDAAARESGGYFAKRKRIAPKSPACNDANARRLWEVSEALERRAPERAQSI